MWFLFKLEEAQEKKAKARQTQGWKLFNVEGNSARFFSTWISVYLELAELSFSSLELTFLVDSHTFSKLQLKNKSKISS